MKNEAQIGRCVCVCVCMFQFFVSIFHFPKQWNFGRIEWFFFVLFFKLKIFIGRLYHRWWDNLCVRIHVTTLSVCCLGSYITELILYSVEIYTKKMNLLAAAAATTNKKFWLVNLMNNNNRKSNNNSNCSDDVDDEDDYAAVEINVHTTFWSLIACG